MADVQWSDDNYCIACGEDNPQGLHLKFHSEGDDYVCEFTPQRVHQGWQGIVHGGILATLLDEAMNHLLSHHGVPVATAELKVRYRRPARVGERVQVRARLLSERPPLWTAEGEIIDPRGETIATGTAKLMRVAGEAAEPKEA